MRIEIERTPEDTLLAMGLTPPEPPAAVGAYLSWQRFGGNVTTSFQLPWRGRTSAYAGLVGHEVSVDEAIAAARLCALNGLAPIR